MSITANPNDSNEIEGEDRFKAKLVELGLLKEVNQPSKTVKPGRTPIKVKGKLVSQSIIEERR